MLDLWITILNLFITFLQQVVNLLESHRTAQEPVPALTPANNALPIVGHLVHYEESAASRTPSPTPSSTVVDDSNNEAPWTLPTRAAVRQQRANRQSTPENQQVAPTPLSPSAWRQNPTTNQELRTEFLVTRRCGHYCHEVPTPRLRICPVCREQLTTL